MKQVMQLMHKEAEVLLEMGRNQISHTFKHIHEHHRKYTLLWHKVGPVQQTIYRGI